jgi:hypothetical protein
VQHLYSDTLDWMEESLDHLLQKLGLPELILIDRRSVYRFRNHGALEAIFLKLVRVVSGLRASTILLEAGFLQERAAMCRMLDEFQEDVFFLVLAAKEDPQPNILSRYLKGFFHEEQALSAFRAGERVKGRDLVARKDIINYVACKAPGSTDAFRASNASLAISHALSDFVHGASHHIMEMFNPAMQRFTTNSHARGPLFEDNQYDLWNYYYRGIITFSLAAKAFGDASLSERTYNQVKEFERRSGNRKDF